MAHRILVIGGYGEVGREMSRLLAKVPDVHLVVAGRDEAKARALAEPLGASWRRVDVSDAAQLPQALEGVQTVINAFSGPFTGVPLSLPEAALAAGVHCLDVSGSWEYSERVLTLHDRALERGVACITGLGANPCLAGLLLLSHRSHLDTVESGDIWFAMGEGLAHGMSVPALMELYHMFAVPPKVWKGAWVDPETTSGTAMLAGRKVYFGPSITRDLLPVPQIMGLQELKVWNGSMSTLEGVLLLLGMKLGWPRTAPGAARMKRWMEALSKPRGPHPDIQLRVVARGQRGGRPLERALTLAMDELVATALVPSLVACQVADGTLTARGALLPAHAVPVEDFLRRLQEHVQVGVEEG